MSKSTSGRSKKANSKPGLLDVMKDSFEASAEIFAQSISPDQFQMIKDVKSVIDLLDTGPDQKGFSAWSAEKLIRAREKLSRLSEPLGDWISFHETQSDFAYIWRKGKYASDWQPIKSELSKKFKEAKITNVEVDNELTSKYIEEQYYSMFHRRRADYLILLLETVDRMIRSIDSRLRELERQNKLPQSAYHA